MESTIYRPLRKLQNEGFVEKSWHRVDRLGMVAYRLTEKGKDEALRLEQQIIKLIEEWKPLVNLS
jgi:DNA-binding PadR family transcriptional regulator